MPPEFAKRATIVFLILASSLAETGCTIYGRVDERTVSQPLAPMAEPSWPVGTTWHYEETWRLLDSGSKAWWRIESQGSETFTMLDNTGCKETQADLFTPAVHVQDCEFALVDRIRQVTRTGETWPLEVGKSWRYTTSGLTSRGRRWKSSESECLVESSVRVEIEAGAFDTYKVVCRYPNLKKTWYISPRLESAVIYIRDPDGFHTKRYERLDPNLASEETVGKSPD